MACPYLLLSWRQGVISGQDNKWCWSLLFIPMFFVFQIHVDFIQKKNSLSTSGFYFQIPTLHKSRISKYFYVDFYGKFVKRPSFAWNLQCFSQLKISLYYKVLKSEAVFDLIIQIVEHCRIFFKINISIESKCSEEYVYIYCPKHFRL